MPEQDGSHVPKRGRAARVESRNDLEFLRHFQNCAGVKNVLKLEVGRNFLIFEIRFCGTYSMSPGFSSMSSSKFRDASIAFTFRTCASTTPSVTLRNNTTCECLA